MKVYVAAPWTHKAEALEYAMAIEAAGHEITKKWWEHREVPGYLDSVISVANQVELETQAAEDIAGVLAADAFVLLNVGKSEGKAVETGVALIAALLSQGRGPMSGPTTFILVGGMSNLFHYLQVWHMAQTPEDVIALLR